MTSYSNRLSYEENPDILSLQIVSAANYPNLGSSRTQLLVEGETDRDTFEKFFVRGCTLHIAGGRKSVTIQINRFLNEKKWKERLSGHILGIIDADFDRVDGVSEYDPSIIPTEHHDLEMMMITSYAFDKLISATTALEKLHELSILSCDDLRKLLLENVKPIAILSHWSIRSGAGISIRCEKLDFAYFIDLKTLKINIEQLIDEIVNQSIRNYSWDRDSLKKIIMEEMEKEKSDPCDLCRGHDVTKILSLGMVHIFGKRNIWRWNESLGYEEKKKELERIRKELEQRMRDSFDFEIFRGTGLFSSLKEWEQAHNTHILIG